jgi:hypothetical protein
MFFVRMPANRSRPVEDPGAGRVRCLAVPVLALAVACGTPSPRYASSLEAVLREATPENLLAHRQALERALADYERAGTEPPPGLHAELAWYAHRLGDREAAAAALRKELTLHPAARDFVQALERFLAGKSGSEAAR